jgi:UDPglucose 6-dehydrogenase
MKLTMVGTGYVGLVTGACLASTGNEVICLDIDQHKIAMLRRGESPIYEPGLKELIARNTEAGRLHFTTDAEEAYRDADAIFICVGTPPDANGDADVRIVLTVAEQIAEHIERRRGQGPPVIVVKSTVPVGTTERVRQIIAERLQRGAGGAAPFWVANNPEFLKEGAAISDFMKPDRVVVGVENAATAAIMRELYEPFVRQGNPIIITDTRSSEMIKYASNAMLACKISFINEIANLCERFGADVRAVREGMCADHRIGNQFLYPGLGYGGSCFPKDTLALVGMGKQVGYECRINAAVHAVNQDQRVQFWNKIMGHFSRAVGCQPSAAGTDTAGDGRESRPDSPLSGVKLAFWGVAFKPETDDIREAPSLTLMKLALEHGAAVRAFDPVASENLRKELPQVTIVSDMYSVLEGCDALIVCTEWSEFRNPDFVQVVRRLKPGPGASGGRVIFDGRNIYRRQTIREHGFTYYCVGSPPVNSPQSESPPLSRPRSTPAAAG